MNSGNDIRKSNLAEIFYNCMIEEKYEYRKVEDKWYFYSTTALGLKIDAKPNRSRGVH